MVTKRAKRDVQLSIKIDKQEKRAMARGMSRADASRYVNNRMWAGYYFAQTKKERCKTKSKRGKTKSTLFKSLSDSAEDFLGFKRSGKRVKRRL